MEPYLQVASNLCTLVSLYVKDIAQAEAELPQHKNRDAGKNQY